MNLFFKTTFLFALTIAYLIPANSFASSIYFESNRDIIKLGDEFKVDIFLDTTGDTINALEGKLSYPRDILDVKDIQNGNSLVTFWVDSPSATNLQNTGSSTFSGIIPGGYRNEKGYVFSVIFKSKITGKASLALDDLKIIQNNEDTKVETLKNTFYEVNISKEVGSDTVHLGDDKIIPEVFVPIIGKAKDMLDDKYFVVFDAQDKGVGIDHYEVKEGLWGSYKFASSPHVLNNQSDNQIIYVKAVDKNNNERVVVVYGSSFKPWFKSPLLIAILMLVILFIGYKQKLFRIKK